MLAVLLTILKVIGIIILWILLILAVLIALLLFVPFVFRVRIRKENDFSAAGSVSWLGAVIRLQAAYDHELSFSLRILGIQILPRRKKKEKKVRKPEKDETSEKIQHAAAEEKSREEADSSVTSSEEKNVTSSLTGDTSEKEDKTAQKSAESEEKKKRKGKKREKSGRTGEILSVLKEIFSDQKQREVLKKVLSELKTLLGRIRFHEGKGYAEFSLGSPDLTGQVLGVISMFPFSYGRKLRITPDFESEKACFNGDITFSGGLQMIYTVIMVIRLVSDKQVRKLFGKLKK